MPRLHAKIQSHETRQPILSRHNPWHQEWERNPCRHNSLQIEGAVSIVAQIVNQNTCVRCAGSQAEAGSLQPVGGAGAMALKAAIPEADVAGGC